VPTQKNGTKSWWETLPGVLTGISALIGALTAAAVAYVNFHHDVFTQSKDRFFALDAVDVPQSNNISAFYLSAEVAVGSHTWQFPFPPDERFMWPGLSIGKSIYPLPSNTDGATVSFRMVYNLKGEDENRLHEAYRGKPVFLKAPGSTEIVINPIACESCPVLNPAIDRTLATLHFSILDKLP
jgi:hypothetical protein